MQEEWFERYGKAIENPAVRRSDPECWADLTDEQRDRIAEWYFERSEAARKREEEKLSGETSIIYESYLFAAIPFAVYLTCSIMSKETGMRFGFPRAVLYFLLNIVGIFLVECIPVLLFTSNVRWDSEHKRGKAIVIALIVIVASVLLSLRRLGI